MTESGAPSLKLVERSLYYDIYETSEKVIKRTRSLKCKQTQRLYDLQNYYYLENDIDACAHERLERAVEVFKEQTELFLPYKGKFQNNQGEFSREDVRFKTILPFEGEYIEYHFEKERTEIPLQDFQETGSLLRTTFETKLNLIMQALIEKNFVAYVFNEGCFYLDGSAFSLRFHRYEHLYKVAEVTAQHITWMTHQIEATLNRLSNRKETSCTNVTNIQNFLVDETRAKAISNQIFTNQMKLVPLSSGLMGTTYTTADKEFVVKCVPLVNVGNNDMHRQVRDSYYDEVKMYKDMSLYPNDPLPGFVKPIAAFEANCDYKTRPKYETFDLPIKPQLDMIRFAKCCGYIVTKNFENSMTLEEYSDKHQDINIMYYARDILSFIVPFIKRFDGKYHNDLNFGNILVRKGEARELSLYEPACTRTYKKYTWTSLPLEYCIIDFGVTGESKDFYEACLLSLNTFFTKPNLYQVLLDTYLEGDQQVKKEVMQHPAPPATENLYSLSFDYCT